MQHRIFLSKCLIYSAFCRRIYLFKPLLDAYPRQGFHWCPVSNLSNTIIQALAVFVTAQVAVCEDSKPAAVSPAVKEQVDVQPCAEEAVVEAVGGISLMFLAIVC